MLPQYNAQFDLLHLANAFTILTLGFAWWRRGSPEEDQVVSQAATELIEGVSDADRVGKIQNETEINLRDQVTVEEIEDWARDRDLRGWRNRN